MRKPESRIFSYALTRMQCSLQECIFVDNSVKNLKEAEKMGMNTVLFRRDSEEYDGNVVNNFFELDRILKRFD